MFVTVISIIFSGLTATMITILYQKFSGVQNAKRKVFETAVSYRYFISEEENVKSLNSIDIVFHNNSKVRLAWKEYLDETDKRPENQQTIADKYIRLLEEMSHACGYKNIRWDDLKRYYYPSGLSNRKIQEYTLKEMQIKVAEKTAFEASRQENTPPDEQLKKQQLFQYLLKLSEQPDNLSKLLDFIEKLEK